MLTSCASINQCRGCGTDHTSRMSAALHKAEKSQGFSSHDAKCPTELGAAPAWAGRGARTRLFGLAFCKPSHYLMLACRPGAGDEGTQRRTGNRPPLRSVSTPIRGRSSPPSGTQFARPLRLGRIPTGTKCLAHLSSPVDSAFSSPFWAYFSSVR